MNTLDEHIKYEIYAILHRMYMKDLVKEIGTRAYYLRLYTDHYYGTNYDEGVPPKLERIALCSLRCNVMMWRDKLTRKHVYPYYGTIERKQNALRELKYLYYNQVHHSTDRYTLMHPAFTI